MLYEEAGKRIKKLREINRYTREVFAERVDISSKFLYEIETGKKGFSADTLLRVSQELSVSCDYILTGEDNNKCTENIVYILEILNIEHIKKAQGILELIYDLSISFN